MFNVVLQHIKIRDVLIWFVLSIISLSSYGTGFGFRDGAIGRYYTSSNMLFDQYDINHYNILYNQFPITEQTVHSAVVNVNMVFNSPNAFLGNFLFGRNCTGIILGNNIHGGAINPNQYWVLTESGCIYSGYAQFSGAYIDMFSPVPPLTAQNNLYLAISHDEPPLYYNVQGNLVPRAQLTMLSYFHPGGVPVMLARGKMLLMLFQVVHQPGAALPLSVNTTTTMHLISGASAYSGSIMAAGFGQQTIIRNGGVVTGSSEACFLNRHCKTALKLNYTYLWPLQEFIDNLKNQHDIDVTDYISYSCYGDNGDPLLAFNPWYGTAAPMDAGLISQARTVVRDGLCVPNLATRDNPASVYFFTPADINWILTTTGLTNLP